MDNRIGRIAGLAAFVLMLARLTRLIQTGGDAPAWQLIMIASAFLGGVIWWLLAQTVSNRKVAVALFVVGGVILFLRIAVPNTLFVGFIPTPETIEALLPEMARAINTIRFGVAPVFPTAGVVAILSALMWITGGLFVWGAANSSSLAMILPSATLYLQFAVMDRLRTGIGWMIAAAAVIGLGVAALAFERKTEAGRVRNEEGRPIARHARTAVFSVVAIVAIGAVAVSTAGADLVPVYGHFPWRAGSGYGYGEGGVSFDRLANLQQRIIRRSNAVLFTAALDENAPPADEVYWRVEALEDFDGDSWNPTGLIRDFYQRGDAGPDSGHEYRGTTRQVAARIRIEELRTEPLPTAGMPYEINSDGFDVRSLKVGLDGTLIHSGYTYEGLTYQVQSVLALTQDDMAAMATLPNGSLSPMFAGAVEAGDIELQPDLRSTEVSRPSDIERFIELPEDTPTSLAAQANQVTAGATTDFERAWLLQYWFRDSGAFDYSVDVTTGHGSLELDAWLGDPTSQNYREGYCEQFAAAMAVLGRAQGIPSRVIWGFTPGEAVTQSDGTEAIVVRDTNAHAWVEMWMDGFGWVRFDPTPRGGGFLPESVTASFVATDYIEVPETPDGDLPDLLNNPNELIERGFQEDLGEGGLATDTGGFPWLWILLPVLAVGLIAVVPVSKRIRRNRRLAILKEGDITAAWDEIVDRLKDLGQPIPEHLTPMEFATGTDEALVPLAQSYSAAVYGERNGFAHESDLEIVEDWLRRRYEGGQRVMARFNPSSLIKRS